MIRSFGILGGSPVWTRTAAAAGAGLLALGLLAALGFGAWRLFDWTNDRAAVAEHETQVRAEVTRRELEAERTANRNDTARRAVREARTEALHQALEDRIDEPNTRAVAGPAVRAVMRELRAQAGADSRPAP